MICTTLNKIRDHGPCRHSWVKLLESLDKPKADDEPLSLIYILDTLGLDDTLWCLRTLPEHNKKWRLFAIWCARKVQRSMTDQRSIDALDVAERFANGGATEEEMAAARDAAWIPALAYAGAAAWTAAGDAAWAAAGDAAWAAARCGAGDEQEKEFRRIIS